MQVNHDTRYRWLKLDLFVSDNISFLFISLSIPIASLYMKDLDYFNCLRNGSK